MRNRRGIAVHTPPVHRGVSDMAAHGSVTNEPHVLLLCTDFMLEFKQGKKGSHWLMPAK